MINKSYLLQKNVNITIDKEVIKLQKGIFNFTNIEIVKTEDISDQDFNLLKKYFLELVNNKEVTIDQDTNPKISNMLEELDKYEFLSEKTVKFIPKYLVTDFKKIELLKRAFPLLEHCTIINLNDLDKIKELKNTDVLILVNTFILSQLKAINSTLIKNKVRTIYLINDGDYIHALYVDDRYTGCFECFTLRMIARINEWEKYQSIINDSIKSNLENNNTNLWLLTAFINAIIEKSNNFNTLLLESKIFSIYLPNFEFHIDRLLKIPFCPTCGHSSQRQSQELNINLKQSMKELLQSEK